MADHARIHLDDMIAEGLRVANMLTHLADVAKQQQKPRDGVYQGDVIESLLYAKRVVRSHVHNLEHVRALYDGKVHGAPDSV